MPALPLSFRASPRAAASSPPPATDEGPGAPTGSTEETSDLCTRALRDDPFADMNLRRLPSLAPSNPLDTTGYSPRQRVAGRTPGHYGLPRSPAIAAPSVPPGALPQPPTASSSTLSRDLPYPGSTSRYVPEVEYGRREGSSADAYGFGEPMMGSARPSMTNPTYADYHAHESSGMPLAHTWSPPSVVPAAPTVAAAPPQSHSTAYNTYASDAVPVPTDHTSPTSDSREHDNQNDEPITTHQRKRQFKYLTDDLGPAQPTTKPALDPPESRKKVKRACIFCKRSHMPCDVSRPCKRCVKRGIAHLCKDEPPTEAPTSRKRNTEVNRRTSGTRSRSHSAAGTAGTGGTVGPGGTQSSVPRTSPAATTTTTANAQANAQANAVASTDVDAPPSKGRVLLPISLLLTNSPFPSNTPTTSHAPVPTDPRDAHGPSAELLETTEEVQQLMTFLNGYDQDLLRSILRGEEAHLDLLDTDPNAPQDSPDNVALKQVLRHSSNVIQEEALTLAVMRARPNEAYTWGYSRLAQWMKEALPHDTKVRVDATLGKIRMQYLRSSLGMTPEQLRTLESATMTGISHYRLNVFETVPHAMFVSSRTGRLLAANARLARWLRVPQHMLCSGEIFYFNFCHSPDIPLVFDAYTALALNALSGSQSFPQPSHPSATDDVDSRPGTASLNGMSYTSLIHGFDVDRQRHLRGKPAWNFLDSQYLPGAPHQLDDGTPSVVQFQAHVTLQARMHESSNGVPLFLVAYVSEAIRYVPP